MRDFDWFWIIGLLVAGLFLWRKLAQGPSDSFQTDRSPEITIPSAPRPGQELDKLVGQTTPKPSKAATSVQPPSPKSPAPRREPQSPTATKNGRKPPLLGPKREEWQKQQWEKKEQKHAEDRAVAGEIAELNREEKKNQDEVDKAKAMAAAQKREDERRAKEVDRTVQEAEDRERERQRQDYIHQKVPGHIQRDMDRFQSGEFDGPEQSPLTYVGYHVGVVRGLPERDRHERLEVCFRVPIPGQLYAEYKHWGDPATTRRLNAMTKHIGQHAAMRASDPKYDRAVSEWHADRRWLQSTLGPKAEAFTLHWRGEK